MYPSRARYSVLSRQPRVWQVRARAPVGQLRALISQQARQPALFGVLDYSGRRRARVPLPSWPLVGGAGTWLDKNGPTALASTPPKLNAKNIRPPVPQKSPSSSCSDIVVARNSSSISC